MSLEECIQKLDAAIEEANSWASKGWNMQFGMHDDRVASLSEAEGSPESFHNRQEALAFWSIVSRTSEEAVAEGKKARAALDNGDIKTAMRAVFFAMFKERQLLERTTTWRPIYEALSKNCA
ncbi:hypothetical protein ACQZV8_11330 [Magnetococcales bacterium HHB-1]